MFWLLCSPLFGETIEIHASFKGEAALSLRTLQQAFYSIGHRFEIDSFTMGSSHGEVSGKGVGGRAFNPSGVIEALKSSDIRIEKWSFEAKRLTLELDSREGIWNLSVLGQDDGAELDRLNTAQWFRLEGGEAIRIQPPYVGRWYPEVAIFDATLELLSSIRSSEPKEELEFELPPDARYLKISNVQGMKVLKEGMWIESIRSGQ